MLSDLIAEKYYALFSLVPIKLETEEQRQSVLALREILKELQVAAQNVNQLEMQFTHLTQQWQSTSMNNNAAFFHHVPHDTWYTDMTSSINTTRQKIIDQKNTVTSLATAAVLY